MVERRRIRTALTRLWLAGGDIRAGYAHGATDDFSYQAMTDRMSVQDLRATHLHQLGLDHRLLGGFFNLPSLLALEEASGSRARQGKAKNVLLLYLQGGPATQDMFDLKPDAPAEVRGEFRPVATSAPGVRVCEHLPQMAKWMHKAVVVRSVYHKGGCHNNLPMYTGYDVPPPDDSPRDTDPPSMGSVCLYQDQNVLGSKPGELPRYVYLPCPLGWGEARRKPGPCGGFLGQ